MKKSRVFVDGALIGLVENPRDLVANLRKMRRKGEIPTEINVSFKEYNGDVIIHTDRGRARRPLIVLEKGKPLIAPEDIERLADGLVPFGDLVKRGLVEFIDAEEEEDLFIAIHEKDITPEHTHLEIDPSLVLGIAAAHVPFPEHNASPRVTMGAGMV
ncbi:MAG: DNA-directed RNA polymerase subunit B, partial [Methanomicrobiales archaeon]|nr:DNA-directed RNA polymerase subunit B [Methanomicrobiales archaeon]